MGRLLPFRTATIKHKQKEGQIEKAIPRSKSIDKEKLKEIQL